MDTPILLRNPDTNKILIKNIEDISNEWFSYPEFKMFDKSIRLEKEYSKTNLEVWLESD